MTYEPDFERIVEDRAIQRFGDDAHVAARAEARETRRHDRTLADADWAEGLRAARRAARAEVSR